MSVFVLLMLFSIIVAIIFLVAFIWAVKTGQFDDPYSPSVRMLFDDKIQNDEKEISEKTTSDDNSVNNDN